ncbi:MAG: SPOR domain-containing protein [Gammaproteobacteria bacterium WSBS_2016_MAG_OTU1]
MSRPPTIRRRNNNAPKSGIGRAILFLALGFTGGIGVAAYFAVYINELPLPLSAPPTRDSNSPGEESTERTRRETLQFHETLRQRQAPSAPKQATNEPEAHNFVYYVQLGAFADESTAEELRGEIALQGSEASIAPGKTGSGGNIFRVWLGPYITEEEAEESRAQLALQGYNQVQLLKLAKDN